MGTQVNLDDGGINLFTTIRCNTSSIVTATALIFLRKLSDIADYYMHLFTLHKSLERNESWEQ